MRARRAAVSTRKVATNREYALAPVRILADAEIGPDGSAQVFLRPLEGCYSRALTLQEALQKAPSKMQAHLAWLQRHGEKLPQAWWQAPIEKHEMIHGDWPVRLGDSVALFECDGGPMTENEIERNLRHMRYSWQDFLGLFERVPEGAWGWKPGGQVRSIRRIVTHVALVMVWYVMKLRQAGKDPPFRWPRGISMWKAAHAIDRGDLTRERLEQLREACVYRLRNLRPTEKSGRVTYHRESERHQQKGSGAQAVSLTSALRLNGLRTGPPPYASTYVYSVSLR